MRGWWLLVMVACPAAQPPEEPLPSPGDPCERDAGSCSHAERVACSLERIAEDAGGCGNDDDCTLFQFPPNCLNYGRCGVPVSFQREAAFSIEASQLISANCGLSCSLPTCRTGRPVCERGRCRVASGGDGGSDAGQRDGGLADGGR